MAGLQEFWENMGLDLWLGMADHMEVKPNDLSR